MPIDTIRYMISEETLKLTFTLCLIAQETRIHCCIQSSLSVNLSNHKKLATSKWLLTRLESSAVCVFERTSGLCCDR